MEGNEEASHLAEELLITNDIQSKEREKGPGGRRFCGEGEREEEEGEEGDLLEPGEIVLGRGDSYRVLRVLGEGNCSIVYSAESIETKEHVAIKVFRRNKVHESAAEREQEVLDRLAESQVDTVISLLAAFQHNNLVCFIFEQLDLNIRQLIMKNRRRGLPGWTVQKFARDVLLALQHIHQVGFVHGDIKPGNIMWSGQQGSFKCFDFGLTFEAPSEDGAAHARLVHSPGYRAPEVLAVERARLNGSCIGGGSTAPPGAPSDIWAFGCLLLEAIAGRKLFRTGEIIQKENSILSHVDKLLEESQQLCPSLSSPQIFSEFRDLLFKCLATDPGERITATEALRHPALQATIPVTRQDNILLISPVLKFSLHKTWDDDKEIEIMCRQFGNVVEVKMAENDDVDAVDKASDAESGDRQLFVRFSRVEEAVKARIQLTCPSSNRFSVVENVVIMDKRAVDNESGRKFSIEFFPLELWPDVL